MRCFHRQLWETPGVASGPIRPAVSVSRRNTQAQGSWSSGRNRFVYLQGRCMQRLASGPQLFRNEDSSRERSHWSLGMRPPASHPLPTLHGGWAFCGLRWGVSTSHRGYHITPYNALRASQGGSRPSAGEQGWKGGRGGDTLD